MNGHVIHAGLEQGGWSRLSLAGQLGNAGSEVGRAMQWRGKNEEFFQGALSRALELIDLSMRDSRWKTRLKEIARLREVLCDALTGGKEYGVTLEDINRYLYDFAMIDRAGK